MANGFSRTIGGCSRRALEKLGLDPGGYDVDRTLAWLHKHASGVASGINGRTREQIRRALASDDPVEAVRGVFDIAATSRAAQIAVTQTAALSGFATTEAVRQAGRPAIKTWVVTSRNPRPSHAAMAGQSVAVGELFSNGARWPGDSLLPPDERAGCTCDLVITITTG